jgi:endo-1,4-beta-xylanase
LQYKQQQIIIPIKNKNMRTTYLTKTTASNFKSAALALLVFATSFTACKSSLDDDLTPTSETQNETVMAASDLDEVAEAGSYHLKNKTLRGSFNFPIGAAVVKELLDDPSYANTIIKDFSRLSSESNFKFGSLHPAENKYTYEKADAIVAFAQKHNMQVHGHTLLWAHDGNEPAWILNYKGDAKAWDKLLKDHIYNVVGHFKGKVQSWDVVNEAIKPGGVYTNSIWYRKLGKDYITKAFKYAQEADPKAKLFLNDYGQEYGGNKMKVLLQIVDDAKKQGVTIHGMGFQLHTVLRMEVAPINANLKLAADKGLLIHISELDIAVSYGMPTTFELSDAMARAQGAKYKEIVYGYLNTVPKKQQWGITTWGVSDKTSYFNKGYKNSDHDYPLLFGKNYKAKWAYRGFIEAGLGR